MPVPGPLSEGRYYRTRRPGTRPRNPRLPRVNSRESDHTESLPFPIGPGTGKLPGVAPIPDLAGNRGGNREYRNPDLAGIGGFRPDAGASGIFAGGLPGTTSKLRLGVSGDNISLRSLERISNGSGTSQGGPPKPPGSDWVGLGVLLFTYEG